MCRACNYEATYDSERPVVRVNDPIMIPGGTDCYITLAVLRYSGPQETCKIVPLRVKFVRASSCQTPEASGHLSMYVVWARDA